jgi:hypothetical protein
MVQLFNPTLRFQAGAAVGPCSTTTQKLLELRQWVLKLAQSRLCRTLTSQFPFRPSLRSQVFS